MSCIAIIIPDFDFGGEEKRVVFFANNYLQYFNKVYVIAPKGKSVELLHKEVIFQEMNIRNPTTIIEFLRFVKNNDITCLQGHKRATLPYLLASEKLLGIKSFFNFDNIYPKHNRLFSYFSPKRLVYLSDVLKEYYEPYYHNAFNTTINMGGDFFRELNNNEKEELKQKLGVKKTFTILSLGRLAEQKNHILLIRALALIKEDDFKCLIVGEGPLEQFLKEEVSKENLQDKVIFLGHRKDVEDLLNASDILVQSSIFEGFPNVFIEAVSVGLPIISTDVGSARTLVQENGILIKHSEPLTLAKAISNMRANLPHYKSKVVELKHSAYFNQFTKESMLYGYLKYIKEL